MRTRFVADAGLARVHMTLDGAGDTRDPAVVADLVRRLRALAALRHGHLTIRAAEPEVKRRAGVWGDPGPAAALMRRLRRTFDPRALLSAGRFLD
jgi:FAD/FMN-containing dehydrogenase